MNWLFIFLVSFFGAALSAMGMGGGGILLIYLTVCLGMNQLAAQGINLVFFIPIAVIALIVHMKNKLVKWRIVWPSVLLGLPGVFLGAWLASRFGPEILRKIFGGFLLIVGVRELMAKKLENKA